MEAMARGLLMLSLRLMLLPRLATATAGATARGRLRLSPAMATVTAVDTAMVATVVVMEATDTARGLLSPATAMVVTVVVMAAMAAMAMAAGTMVSYHRIRRSELSQKQNHK